jgi:lipopolysaccharide/colanic/teichoic acid biosynthesis glycosyltransferase
MLPVSKGSEVVDECRAIPQRAGALNRAVDIFCAAAGLFLLSPLFCVIAVGIKLNDGGPIFYKQVRVGRSFRRFRVRKFRSMVAGADRNGLLTAPGDSRLTRVGRLLRQYKLDELPQLFNVLKGEMQLVGARPEVERYVQMFHSQYAVILLERPGITDPASLAYRHEDKIFSADRMEEHYVEEILPAKLKLSLDYQRRRNLLSDFRILLQTVFGLIV